MWIPSLRDWSQAELCKEGQEMAYSIVGAARDGMWNDVEILTSNVHLPGATNSILQVLAGPGGAIGSFSVMAPPLGISTWRTFSRDNGNAGNHAGFDGPRIWEFSFAEVILLKLVWFFWVTRQLLPLLLSVNFGDSLAHTGWWFFMSTSFRSELPNSMYSQQDIETACISQCFSI